MERKVNLVGQHTLTVSIPAGWAQRKKIKKGDVLNVSLAEDSITFSRAQNEEKKRAEVDIDKLNYSTLGRVIIGYYRANYAAVVLHHKLSSLVRHKTGKSIPVPVIVRDILKRMMGAEIVLQTPNRTEIEFLVTDEPGGLDRVEKRICYLFKETLDQLLLAIGGDFSGFYNTRYDYHDNLAKFINYYLRELNIVDMPADEKRAAFALQCLLDLMVDKIRHVSEAIQEVGCTSNCKKYLAEIFTLFEAWLGQMHKSLMDDDLIEKRYALKERIEKQSFTQSDMRVIQEAAFFLDTSYLIAEYMLVRNKGSQ